MHNQPSLIRLNHLRTAGVRALLHCRRCRRLVAAVDRLRQCPSSCGPRSLLLHGIDVCHVRWCYVRIRSAAGLSSMLFPRISSRHHSPIAISYRFCRPNMRKPDLCMNVPSPSARVLLALIILMWRRHSTVGRACYGRRWEPTETWRKIRVLSVMGRRSFSGLS